MAKLRISGEVERPGEFSADDLAALDPEARVRDVGELGARGRCGGMGGVRLDVILRAVGPRPEARFISFASPSDDFHACVPLEALAGRGVIVFERAGDTDDLVLMSRAEGGPFRFVVADAAACRTDEIDACLNVKYLEEIELTAERGMDNRRTQGVMARAEREESAS